MSRNPYPQKCRKVLLSFCYGNVKRASACRIRRFHTFKETECLVFVPFSPWQRSL